VLFGIGQSSDPASFVEARTLYLKALEMKPDDPAVYMQLAGFYQRQGDFDKMIDAVQTRTEKDQKNPEAFYTLSTFYWEKASRDFKLNDTQKLEFAQKGIDAADKALALKQDYPEALTYKGLLLRVQANAEKNPARQQALLRDADQYSKQAAEIRNKQKSGA
jgi:lipoprotein NlpI